MYKYSIKLILISSTLFCMLIANSNNPPNARTGAPGESTCIDCHSSYGLNSGSGSLSLLNIPAEYEVGQSYLINVELTHSGQEKWGFEICVKDEDQNQIGELNVIDNSTTMSGTQNGITYIKQRSAGTFDGQMHNATWTVEWIAPSESIDNITFYASGNASNSAQGNSGDYIYTTLETTHAVQMECLGDGDANLDGVVNVIDIVNTVNYIIGSVEFQDENFCHADVNVDGLINVIDIVNMVNIIIGN